MKKSRYSESQIISILKQAENGVAVTELCRKHGMSDASFYNWRSKYGGMDVFDDETHERAGRGKSTFKEDVRRGAAEIRDCPGGA